MHKKIVAVALLSASLLGADVAKTDKIDELEVTLEQVEQLPSVKAHDFVPKSVQLAGELYLVHGYFDVPGRMPQDSHRKVFADMFLSKDLGTAVYGNGYNVKTGTQFRGIDLDEIRKNVAFSYGNGPEHFFFVTDPHCPFCKDFEKRMSKYADIATFDVLMIPLPMHRDAPDAIRCVLSNPKEKRYATLMEIANGNNPCVDSNISEAVYSLPMQAMENAANELRVNGTPSLFTADGNPFEIGEMEHLYQIKATGATK